jgi:AcrR family transcriptional regulator
MRSHGWSGNTPTSDEEAIDRILNAADDIIAERGTSMRIADVARTLGVTRQTVYRYFPGTEALLVATAMRSADGFLDRLAAHVQGETDPVAAMVEGMAFAIETLGRDSQIGLLLGRPQRGGGVVSITSDTALTFGRAMLHRFDVDWNEHGFDEDALNEMSEFCLRVLHSMLIDPGHPPRQGASLRQFLARWVGPAIAYPHLTRAMSALPPALPKRSRRRSAAS